jgi:hypothetical protein
MVEDIGSVIGKGFETWKKNLIISLPFLLSWILTTVVAIAVVGGAILATIPSLIPYFTGPAKITPDLIPKILPQILQSLSLIIIAIIVTIILSILINAFLWAGAIGMAKEAIRTEQTNLSHMMDYGKRKFVSIIFVNIIIGLISIVGIIFLVPGILYILPKLSTLSELTPGEVFTALAIFGLGFLAMLIYIAIISIVFALSIYVVVIDDVGAIQGIKKGFTFFKHNKSVVFILWIIVLVANLISGSFSSTQSIGWAISLIISAIVVQPLTVIWWSRLYLNSQ